MSPRSSRLASFIILAFLPACSMCGGGPTEPPSRYVAKASGMVIEVPDVGALVARRAAITAKLEGIATKEQIDVAIGELKRTLTFDPTTAEGLDAAGLPKKGAMAIDVIDQGASALFIIPVGDAKKLDATINELVKSKETVVETKQESFEGSDITCHYGQFGPEKMLISAHTIKNGYAFVGNGKSGLEAVKAALPRKKEDSIATHAEYAPLVGSIGEVMVRVIVPSAKEMNAALGAALELPADSIALQMKSVGWGLSLDDKSLAVLLRMRFEESALAKLKAMFATSGKLPAGVASVLSSEAVITVLGAGNVDAVMATLMPPGSELATQFEGMVQAIQAEVGVDVRTQVLAQMSGHAALALGIADPKLLANVRELMRNPARALWSTGSIGLKSPDEIKKLSVFKAEQDPVLTQRGMARTNRTIKEHDIAVLGMTDAPSGVDSMLMETWLSGGAWSFSNTAARTEKMIDAEAAPPADKLAGKGGVIVEIHVAPVAVALRSLDIEALAGGAAEAMLVRGFMTKALSILDRIEIVEGKMESTDDGLAGVARVVFANPPK